MTRVATSDKRERAQIIDQIDRGVNGDPWHGPSVTDALKGVTADQAARRPIPRAHTIWELVLHLAAWKREVARRFDGQPAGDPPEGDWPPMPEPSDAGWHTAKRDLLRSHRTLLAAIADALQLKT
jgi:DinB superfamily